MSDERNSSRENEAPLFLAEDTKAIDWGNAPPRAPAAEPFQAAAREQLTLLRSIDDRLTRLEEAENSRKVRRAFTLCAVLVVLILLAALTVPRALRAAEQYRVTMDTLQQITDSLPPEQLQRLGKTLSTMELPDPTGLQNAIDCLNALDVEALQDALSILSDIDPNALQTDMDTLRGLMDGLKEIDTAELSRAIKNLNTALGPILRLFGKDNG